jgi:hypothetical protein
LILSLGVLPTKGISLARLRVTKRTVAYLGLIVAGLFPLTDANALRSWTYSAIARLIAVGGPVLSMAIAVPLLHHAHRVIQPLTLRFRLLSPLEALAPQSAWAS